MTPQRRRVALAALAVAVVFLTLTSLGDTLESIQQAISFAAEGNQCCQPVVVARDNSTIAAFLRAGALTAVGDDSANGAPLLRRCCGTASAGRHVGPTAEPLLRPVTRAHVDSVARDTECLARASAVRLSACIIVRNRVKLTVEWIQWHRLLGVRRFHVYDDHSDDGLVAALAPFVAAGVVELHAAPPAPFSFRGTPRGGPQYSVYDDCLRRVERANPAAPSREWVALFDSDEFATLSKHACLTDFVSDGVAAAAARNGSRAVGAVALPWAFVGNPGEMRDTARSQLEMTNFSMGVMDPNEHIKSIVRVDMPTGMGNPHRCELAGDAVTVFVTGEEVAGAYKSQPSAAAVALGRLLHYHIRSFASLLQRQVDGRVDGSLEGPSELDVASSFAFWKAHRGPAAAVWPAGGAVRRTHGLLLAAMGLRDWAPPPRSLPDAAAVAVNTRGQQNISWVRCCRR
jgi:hypothetical protein